MAASQRNSATARDARELAKTLVPNPYRGQLADPYSDGAIPAGVALAGDVARAPASPGGPLYFSRIPAPQPATAAGVTGIVLGALIALFGLMLMAILSFQNELGAPDRSFHQGNDASFLLLAFLDYGLAAVFIGGGSGLLSGRVAGRIALTAAGWITIGMCFFWWHTNHVQDFVPIFVGIAAAAMLIAMYDPKVTRWLGVLPAPQPD
jgi:hypothetical protein